MMRLLLLLLQLHVLCDAILKATVVPRCRIR